MLEDRSLFYRFCSEFTVYVIDLRDFMRLESLFLLTLFKKKIHMERTASVPGWL